MKKHQLLFCVVCCILVMISSFNFHCGKGSEKDDISALAMKADSEEYQQYKDTQKYALIIGISDFQDENITDLNYSETDAKSFYDTLTVYNEYPEDNVELLSEKNDCTKSKIKQHFEDLMDRADTSDALFIFFYSGHGVSDEDTNYLLPSDAKLTQSGEIDTSSLIAISDLQEIARTSSAKKLFFLDACRTSISSGEKGLSVVQRYNDENLDNQDAIIISATQQGRPGYESPTYQSSYLSYALNRGFRGNADFDKSGFISISEIIQFTDDGVKKLAQEENREQQISIKNFKQEEDYIIGFSLSGWESAGMASELNLGTTEKEEFDILTRPESAFEQKKIDIFKSCYSIFTNAEQALKDENFSRAKQLYIATIEKVETTPYFNEAYENFLRLHSISQNKQQKIQEYQDHQQKLSKIKQELTLVKNHYDRAMQIYINDTTMSVDVFLQIRQTILQAINVIQSSKYKDEPEYQRSFAQLQEFLEEIDKWIFAKEKQNLTPLVEMILYDNPVNQDRPWYKGARSAVYICKRVKDGEISTNATQLSLQLRELTKINCLDNLTNLQWLGLSGNEISRIEGLDNLTNLQELWLHGNLLENFEGLENLKNLKTLYIDYSSEEELNQIKQMYPWIEKIDKEPESVD